VALDVPQRNGASIAAFQLHQRQSGEVSQVDPRGCEAPRDCDERRGRPMTRLAARIEELEKRLTEIGKWFDAK
jgi:hypothetical protein